MQKTDTVTVLEFSEKELEVTQIALEKVPEKTLYAKSTWDKDNLKSKLNQIQIKFDTNSLRVILADDLTKSKKEFKILKETTEELGIKLDLVESLKVANDLYKDPVLGIALQESDKVVEKVQKEVEEEGENKDTSDEIVIRVPRQETGSLEENNSKPSKSNKLFFIIPLILILIVAGIYGYITYTDSPASQPEPTIQPEVVITESPSPSPVAVEPSEYTVQVLNGSGTAGLASSAQEDLEEAGFEDVEVGNADNYDYTDTIISLKEDAPSSLDALLEDLFSDYVVEIDRDLDEDSDYDIVIILGSSSSDE